MYVIPLAEKSQRAIRLSLTTFLYLVFGAVMFGWFENDADNELRADIRQKRETLQEKYNFTEIDFELLEDTIIKSIPFSAGYQWKFAGAFYFCTVVITTVGYGHSTPSTISGKLFYMIFALAGIPLGLVMFQSIGERVNTGIKTFLTKAGKILSKNGIKVLREVKIRHLLLTSASIGSLIILIGTTIFHKKENWSVFDSFYYCVITLSTIGLGDHVAAQTNDRLETDIPYVLFTLFFILFGLAIFSACINLLILQFMAHNADIVTAHTRLRRFLSLRRSNTRPKPLPSPPNKYNVTSTVSLDKTKHMEATTLFNYYPSKPVKFVVRRPPINYIDHLVNITANSSKI